MHNSNWLLALAFIGPMFGQSFSAGVKAGVPVTDFFETGMTGSVQGSAVYSSATRRYTLGVVGEWHATKSLGLEVDAMYHRLGYGGTIIIAGTGFSQSIFRVTGNAWDFPILAKYRFGHAIRPYVAAGATLRYIGPVQERGELTSLGFPSDVTTAINTRSPTDLDKRFYPGLTAATGVEFGVGRLRILPELRYTRWVANISSAGGLLRIAPDQVEILVGAEF